jgi:hypothetical protein
MTACCGEWQEAWTTGVIALQPPRVQQEMNDAVGAHTRVTTSRGGDKPPPLPELSMEACP